MHVTQRQFIALVRSALDGLPDGISAWLDNIEVVVEDRASRDQLRSAGLEHPDDLLGLYEGLPLTARTSDYGMVVPDRITLFRRSILAVCERPADVEYEVRRTVLHELAHHFGIDDDRLEELDAY